MRLTATHIAYYHLCPRKLWLFANGITMEHTSDVVAEGKLIGDTSYAERAQKFTEVEIDGVKIDYYDARNNVVHEVKKSARVEQAHIAQVQYYLYKLRQKGVEGTTGLIEYPRLKQREAVAALIEEDVRKIEQWEKEIESILTSDQCPDVIQSRLCKSCSYFDFCYSTES